MNTDERPVVVVVEDRPKILDVIATWADEALLTPVPCANADKARAEIDRHLEAKDLIGVVSDLKLTGEVDDGWEVLSYAYQKSKSIRLALYTAFGDQPVQALFKSGAAVPSFTVFRKTIDAEKLRQWFVSIRESWDARFGLSLKDADTRRTYEVLAPVYARSSLPILVLGETGTGKESLARHIHATSRRSGALLPVNCGGLEPSLAFSELFGHTANAFTDADYHELGLMLRASGYKPGPRQNRTSVPAFEEWLRQANPDLTVDMDGLLNSPAAAQNAGSLFLDEVTTLPRKVMAGLLRVLSTSDVAPFGHYGPRVRAHCRIIAATNETTILESAVLGRQDDVSSFRRDLCYRLGGAILTLPALRDRDPEDIRNYIRKTVWRQLELQELPIQEAALDYVVRLYKGRADETARQYQLGNFRSLKNLVYRAALIAMEEGGTEVSREHIELAAQHGRLIVMESETLSQERHIRETFRRALQRQSVEIDENFSWDELKTTTVRNPIVVAYGYLVCCLQIKLAPDRGYYQSSEIQRFLTQGLALNAWLGKSLTREHILTAVTNYFCVDTSEWPPDIGVSVMVQRLREAPNERTFG